jgi:hypothetical protein
VSALPWVQRLWAQGVTGHVSSPQTEATSATQAAPQVLLQHDGLTVQIMATHGSHEAVSLAPVLQSLWAHVVLPELELDDVVVELDEALVELDADVALELALELVVPDEEDDVVVLVDELVVLAAPAPLVEEEEAAASFVDVGVLPPLLAVPAPLPVGVAVPPAPPGPAPAGTPLPAPPMLPS